MTKMTKKEAFKLAQEALSTIENADADRAWTVLQNEIDRLERVALKAKNGETKADKEKAAFRAQILDYITEQGGTYRAGEIATSFGVSTQKASAALNTLVNEGALRKVNGEKRTVLFTVANDAE